MSGLFRSLGFLLPIPPLPFSFPFGFPGLSALGFPDLIADKVLSSRFVRQVRNFLMELYFKFKKVTTTGGGEKCKPKSLEKARERFKKIRMYLVQNF